MRIHPELDKWIHASIAKHLRESVPNTPLLVQSELVENPDEQEGLELYIKTATAISHGLNHMYVDIYVGCQVKHSVDTFAMQSLVGKVKAALTSTICIKKWASQVQNPETIGSLRFRDDLRYPLDGMNFGVVGDKSNPLSRETVEGHYEMFLTSSDNPTEAVLP